MRFNSFALIQRVSGDVQPEKTTAMGEVFLKSNQSELRRMY
jgi:hypothetical protein